MSLFSSDDAETNQRNAFGCIIATVVIVGGIIAFGMIELWAWALHHG